MPLNGYIITGTVITLYINSSLTVGVIMETLKHFGIGIGLFGIITLTILGIEYITVDMLSMTPKAVGNTLMILALLIIAKPFGELSVSVYNNTVKKQ